MRESFIWLTVERLGRLIVSTLTSLLVARYLGAEGFGQIAYVYALLTFLVALSGFGLDGVLLQRYSQQERPAYEVYFHAQRVRILAFGVSGFFALLLWIGLSDHHRPIFVCMVGFIAVPLLMVSEKYYQATRRIRFVTIASLAVALLVATFRVLAIWMELEIEWFAVLAIADAVVLGLVIHFKRIIERTTEYDRSWHATISLAKFGFPLLLSTFAILVYSRIDQVMLEYLSTGGELGRYAIAIRISESWIFLPVILASSVHPALSALGSERLKADFSVVSRYMRHAIGLAVAAILVTWMIICPVLAFFMGSEFEGTASILAVHVTGLLFVAIGLIREKVLLVFEKPRLALYSSLVGAVLNIGLNMLLIPRLGGLGAAIATVLSYSLAAYLSSVCMNLGIPLFKLQSTALLRPCLPFDGISSLLRNLTKP